MKEHEYFYLMHPAMTADECAALLAASFGFTLDECKEQLGKGQKTYDGEIGRFAGVTFIKSGAKR